MIMLIFNLSRYSLLLNLNSSHSSSITNAWAIRAILVNHQTTTGCNSLVMWMKGPKRWFTIVWVLGICFLFCFLLFYYCCSSF